MNITSRYPWPVLGDGDAIFGTFAPIIEIIFGKDAINIRGNLNLDNKTIQDLISSGWAHYVVQIACKATHLRQCYSFVNSQFEIPPILATELRGIVQLDYLVVV